MQKEVVGQLVNDRAPSDINLLVALLAFETGDFLRRRESLQAIMNATLVLHFKSDCLKLFLLLTHALTVLARPHTACATSEDVRWRVEMGLSLESIFKFAQGLH